MAKKKPLPAADALPSREDIAPDTQGTRAVPVPDDVPESLKKVIEAIRTGQFDPAKQIEAIRQRNLELKRFREEEKATYDNLRKTPAADWKGKDTPFQDVLWLKAETWEEFRLFDVPNMEHDGYVLDPVEWKAKTVRCPGTNFYYANKTLPLSYSLSTAVSRKRQGRVFFDGPVVMPVLFEQMGPEEDFRQRVWMGLTPMEMITQRKGIDMARGRVVVGGLGLGWFLKEIADKPEVTEIVVVDLNPQLFEWIVPRLKEKFPNVAAKLSKCVAGDVYQFMFDEIQTLGPTDETLYLLDIWPMFGDADYDRNYVQFEHVLGDRIWGWGRGATYDGESPKLDANKPLPYERAYIRKKPCTGCPFSRTGDPAKDDPEGNTDPLRLLAQAMGPFMLPCHQEGEYAEQRFAETFKLAQCAGAATYRSNLGMGKLYPPAFHILPADHERVFSTPAEMLAHYNGISLAAATQILADKDLSKL